MKPPLKASTSCSLLKVEIAFAALAVSPRDEGEGGRALEQLGEPLLAGLVGGEFGEPVLDDPEAGVGLAQLGAQLSGLGDADAAVVDREDRFGALDLGGDLLYGS